MICLNLMDLFTEHFYFKGVHDYKIILAVGEKKNVSAANKIYKIYKIS